VVLTHNPDYFDKGYPYINECRILSTPDATTHLAAFRTGQSDILVLQSLADVETLRKTNSTAVVEEVANVLAPFGLDRADRHDEPPAIGRGDLTTTPRRRPWQAPAQVVAA
jgi:hypothetical protein